MHTNNISDIFISSKKNASLYIFKTNQANREEFLAIKMKKRIAK